MSKEGTVRAINTRRGMVAIKSDDGGFTIIEMMGNFAIELGDRIAWSNDYGLGGEVYRNLTSGESGDVYVQDHDVSELDVRRKLSL